MKREDLGTLSPMEQVTRLQFDSDRLSFLDGLKVYIEIRNENGPEAYIARTDEGWETKISRNIPNYRAYHKTDNSPHETLRDAIDELEAEWKK